MRALSKLIYEQGKNHFIISTSEAGRRCYFFSQIKSYELENNFNKTEKWGIAFWLTTTLVHADCFKRFGAWSEYECDKR